VTLSSGEPAEAPLVLIKGDATDEEVAALVAVLSGIASASSAATAAPGDVPAPVSAWAAPARKVRTPLLHGPGGWRASGLPR
jgi:hypothetical protein